MISVGITGGIGTGKSTVAKVFSALGIPVYDADQRAKFLIENNLSIINSIKELFGNDAYLENGVYNKKYVSAQVFENPECLKKLNQIVHPAVGLDFENWKITHQEFPYILKEAAIMNKNSGLDKIIVVSSPIDLRVSRIKNRDGRSLEQIEAIIANQKSEKEFTEIADFVIYNNELDFIIPQILAIDKSLKSQK